jgi:hypothetical protein
MLDYFSSWTRLGPNNLAATSLNGLVDVRCCAWRMAEPYRLAARVQQTPIIHTTHTSYTKYQMPRKELNITATTQPDVEMAMDLRFLAGNSFFRASLETLFSQKNPIFY